MPAPAVSVPAHVRSSVLAAVGDIVVVLAFAATGRGFHNEEDPIFGVMVTAWPFLVGLALAWLLPIVHRRPLAVWPTAIVVWLAVYAVGMILRAITGAGLAMPFLVVALCVLGTAFLGWRAMAAFIRRVLRR